MKNKIVILGSTGSIGKKTLQIVKENKKDFNVELLSTNKNISLLFKQAKFFKVKNLIITDYKKFLLAKKKFKSKKYNIYNSFLILDTLFKEKELHYVMISILGIDGLNPSLKLIKFTRNIAIVNKESIISGWHLIKKELDMFNTKFIPIDSEHFSLFSLINKDDIAEIDKIYITASGGPFLKTPLYLFSKIKRKDALRHPNWKMGKKISIDSASMMNKVFEIIEAKKIFNIPYKKIKIFVHPKSYVHSIIKYKGGLIKFLAHEPDMKIPIYNSLYFNSNNRLKHLNYPKNILNISVINNLDFQYLDIKRFPLASLIKNLKEKDSLYESIIIVINDYFVMKFLNNQIDYKAMIYNILKFSNLKFFLKYRKITPKSAEDIYKIKKFVSLKLNSLSI